MSRMAQKRDATELEKRRLKAAGMFAKDMAQAQVAERLGVARQSVNAWHKVWLKGGADALRSKGRTGPKPALTDAQLKVVAKALLAGPSKQGHATELWTLPRVGALIGKVTGRRFHSSHVSRILHALGFSCQRPTRRAIERDEKAVSEWKRTGWPAIKKKPARSDAPSSSSTKAA